MKYNEKMRLFFKNKRLSQKEVSEILGPAPAMISRFLNGTSDFGPEFIISLVKAFPDIDLKYIFSEDEESKNIDQVEVASIYGSKDKKILVELEEIEKKVLNIKKYLAQKSHEN
jgi:transcriptional regulator with XRE-family HTH domain